ncbi:RAFTIN1a protein [Zea mays]|uniref:RAFTIN1a protein n=1 Tax=Zea mays TaxID=4577 RepID=A0A1D6KI51_MAIZE|nr:RAFTIN1a protein [Zea mays]
MARFASAVLFAAVLLMAGRLTHAGPSTAEVLWRRAVLPGSAVPNAVLRLLRPYSHFVSEANAEDTGRSNAPFNYQNYKRSSATATSPPGDRSEAGLAGGSGARDDTPFSYSYRAPSQQGVPASGGARDDTPFSYSYRAPSQQEVPASGGARDDTPFSYSYRAPSQQEVPASGGARDDTPFSYSYRAPSQGVPASGVSRDDTTFSYDDYKARSQAVAGSGPRDDQFSYDYSAYEAPIEHHHSEVRATARSGGVGTPTPHTAVFFHEEAVRVGERLPLHFQAAAPAALGFLPRRAADSIPFTTAALPAVLALFGVAPSSSRAAAMAETLRTCERPPPAGEAGARFCATSLEALVERAVAALGTRDIRAVTSALPRAGLPPQAYAVRAVRRVGGGPSFVACHDEAYPYTVYRCHDTGPARAYLVEMEGARGGGAITVATVCHTDTSRWNPEHVSFKLLGTKPGGAPVCHLMPYGHIIWAKNVKPSPA